jgi:hypothetical protein
MLHLSPDGAVESSPGRKSWDSDAVNIQSPGRGDRILHLNHLSPFGGLSPFSYGSPGLRPGLLSVARSGLTDGWTRQLDVKALPEFSLHAGLSVMRFMRNSRNNVLASNCSTVHADGGGGIGTRNRWLPEYKRIIGIFRG